MKTFYKLILLGGVATVLVCPGQSSLADTKATKGKQPAKTATKLNADEPVVNELAPGYDRNINFGKFKKKPNVPQTVTPTAVVPIKKVNTVVKTAATTTVKKKPATVIITKSPRTPVQVTKIDNRTKSTTITAVKPVTTTTTQTRPSDVVPVSTQSAAPFITAWLDRPGKNPRYKVGDKMVINLSSTVDCNVVVYNYDAENNLTQIYPNDLQKEARIRAGQTIQVGGDDSPFDYTISGKGGTERIFVYAYPTSQSGAGLTVALAPQNKTPFQAANNVSMDQYVAMVCESQVFTTRGVQVVPRKKVQNTSAKSGDPNKLELIYKVEP